MTLPAFDVNDFGKQLCTRRRVSLTSSAQSQSPRKICSAEKLDFFFKTASNSGKTDFSGAFIAIAFRILFFFRRTVVTVPKFSMTHSHI